MKIKANIDVYCPSGFYCMRNGNNKCSRMSIENKRPYCELFYPFLDTDSKGNVLKCEECLLAERRERKEV